MLVAGNSAFQHHNLYRSWLDTVYWDVIVRHIGHMFFNCCGSMRLMQQLRFTDRLIAYCGTFAI